MVEKLKISKSNSLYKQDYSQKPLISVDAQKALNKRQHSLMIKKKKNLKKLWLEGTYLKISKAVHENRKHNIIVNGGKTEIISFKSRTRQRCPLLVLLFKTTLRIQVRRIREEKEIKNYNYNKSSQNITLCR